LKLTHPTAANANNTYAMSKLRVADVPAEKADEYYGSIAKSTDGGETWRTVYTERGEFYFNEISCQPVPGGADSCVAVGEASAGPNPGARVYHSGDGGLTWTQVFFAQGVNVMAVQVLANGEAWFATSRFQFDPFGFVSTFYYSTNYGASFTATQELSGFNVFGLSILPNGRAGFAAGMTNDQQCAIASMVMGKSD